MRKWISVEYNLILFVQVLPLVPPGRKANEEGSPYSGQVTLFIPIRYLFIVLLLYFHFFFSLVGGGDFWEIWMCCAINQILIENKIFLESFLRIRITLVCCVLSIGLAHIINYLLLLILSWSNFWMLCLEFLDESQRNGMSL